MALTLLRHSAPFAYYTNRYNGWSNISIDPACFDIKKVEILQRINFDSIYSSDLVRCIETLDKMGIEDYFTDTRLREVCFKDEIEGLNYKEIEKLSSFRIDYTQNRQRWHHYICKEHPALFEGRIRSFLNDLPKDKEILICSHSSTLQKMTTLLGYQKNKIDYLEWVRIDNVI